VEKDAKNSGKKGGIPVQKKVEKKLKNDVDKLWEGC